MGDTQPRRGRNSPQQKGITIMTDKTTATVETLAAHASR
ncbi:tail fiber protein [Nocardia cyriacigeorgica]